MTCPQVIRAALDCDTAQPHRGAFAAVGNMDGVHLGHQSLLRVAGEVAGDRPLGAVVFDPHPRRVFQPDVPPFMLTDLQTKATLLGALGVKTVFVLPFVEGLYRQDPATFVQSTLAERLGLSGIVTGADFQFGAGRAGDAATLKALAEAAGMEAHAIAPIGGPGAPKYSSSQVRAALREGRPADAAQILGRPWRIRGEVIEGRRLARTLDFPTANIPLGEYLHPAFGAYVVRAEIDGVQVGGVANIGIKPTVGTDRALLEAHFFDVTQDLYGQTLGIDILAFLRPERRFDGLDALKTQISQDAAAARAFFGAKGLG